MKTIIGIAIAGAIGALARFGVEGWVSSRSGDGFPWGTFVVNVTGAFILGFVFTVLTEKFRVEPWVRTTLTVGFLGAYTTFSTLSFETFRLIEDGAVGLGMVNAVGSLTAGLVAVYLGVVLGRLV
jgi:CrcB protein